MNILKQKFFAVLVMSLVIFISLVLMAKVSIGKAIVILLFLLAIFTVIDLIVQTNVFTEKQSRLVSIAIGGVVIMGIGIFGAFTVPATPTGNEDDLDQGKMSSSTVIDETYDLGLYYYERGDYEEAIKTLKEVANSSDSYVDAQKLIAEATDQYRANLTDTANTYAESGEYELATNILNAGLLVIPEDQELLHTIEEYSLAHTAAVRATAIEGAKTAAENENYGDALLCIRDASNELGSDAELDALYDNYMAKYKSSVLEQAASNLQSDGYISAIETIQKGLEYLPGDSEFISAIELYKSYKPVSLDTLEIWQDGNLGCGPYTHETWIDNYGNTYDTIYTSDTGYNVYKIDGAYTVFSGVFCMEKEHNSCDRPSYLYIYGDDTLLDKYEIRGGDAPIEFAVDISGVSLLKIRPQSALVWGGAETSFAANLFVEK